MQVKCTYEDAVAPVVRRFQNKVDTKELSKLTALTLDDCKVMREAYGRCSKLLHSESEQLNRPLPKPEIIQAEIEANLTILENGFSEENFIYDLLLAYGVPKNTITLLKIQ